jgi:hypothetical protein
MKLSIANAARARYITNIMSHLAAEGEDVALVASNVCNLPIVEDGEEGVLEVCVKVVKKPYDECMQEREDYVAKCADAEEKKAKREKDAAEKKAKAEAKRKIAEETAAAVLARAKAKAEA